MMAMELVRPGTARARPRSRPAASSQACHRAGVVVLTCGSYGNVIRLLPPLVIEEALLADGLDVLAGCGRRGAVAPDMTRPSARCPGPAGGQRRARAVGQHGAGRGQAGAEQLGSRRRRHRVSSATRCPVASLAEATAARCRSPAARTTSTDLVRPARAARGPDGSTRSTWSRPTAAAAGVGTARAVRRSGPPRRAAARTAASAWSTARHISLRTRRGRPLGGVARTGGRIGGRTGPTAVASHSAVAADAPPRASGRPATCAGPTARAGDSRSPASGQPTGRRARAPRRCSGIQIEAVTPPV